MEYTKEELDKITQLYLEEGKTPKELAEIFNKPERSIIAKLSNAGFYRKKVYLDKNGQMPIKKEEYVSRIAAKLGVDEDLVGSLEKVNKNVLKLLDEALVDL